MAYNKLLKDQPPKPPPVFIGEVWKHSNDTDKTWRIVSIVGDTVTLTGPGTDKQINSISLQKLRNTWVKVKNAER